MVELCDLAIIDPEELIQACHHGKFTAIPFTAFFLNERRNRIVCRFVHHIALHDFVPGLMEIVGGCRRAYVSYGLRVSPGYVPGAARCRSISGTSCALLSYA